MDVASITAKIIIDYAKTDPIASYFAVHNAMHDSHNNSRRYDVDLNNRYRKITEALQSLNGTEYCEGTIRRETRPMGYGPERIQNPPWNQGLRYHSAEHNLKGIHLFVDQEDMGLLTDLNLGRLLAKATPAPFGKGEETVLDESVRKAMEIAGHRISLVIPKNSITAYGLCVREFLQKNHKDHLEPGDAPKLKEAWTECKADKEAFDAISARANTMNVPSSDDIIWDPYGDSVGATNISENLGLKFRATLYKMHIYQPGGHFEEHADTLHGPDHMATLVIGLPVKHKGGALVVKSFADALDKRDFGEFFSTGITTSLPYAAFFTDCKHTVKPVTEGTRVVLQYDLFKEPNNTQDEEKNEEDEEDEDQYTREETWFSTHGANQTDRFAPDDDNTTNNIIDTASTMGRHNDQLLQNLVHLLSKHKGQRLALLLRHHYSMNSLSPKYLKGVDRIVYQILRKHFTLELDSVLLYATGDYDDGSGVDEMYGRSFSISEIDGKPRTWADEQDPPMIITPFKEAYRQCLEHQDYIEHTGNESAPSQDFYHCAVIIVNCGEEDEEDEDEE